MKEDRTEMSFLEHLEELRWHIIRSLLAVFLFAVVAFINKNIVFDKIILAPKSQDFLTNRLLCQLGEEINFPSICINARTFELKNIYMSGQFTAHIKISIIAGLILSFPYIFFEFWRFIRPALYKNERRNARGAVFYISFLFITGVLFGYYVIAPMSVAFLGSYVVSNAVGNEINLMSYVSTITNLTLVCGIIFELPAIIFFLSKVGIVTPEFLRKYRKHAIIVILVLAAIITPSADILTQLLVSVPLAFLYEISIIISARVQRKKELEMAG